MKRTLENLIADASFVLWLKGEGSVEDQRRWDSWARKDPDHQMLVREAKEIVYAVDKEYDIPDPASELEELNSNIDQFERQRQFNQLVSTFSSDNQPYRKIGRRAAAAVILLAVMLGGITGNYYNEKGIGIEQELVEVPTTEKYHTNYGEKLSIRLSDGSKITLNGNSSATFSKTKDKGLDAEVWLEGEAYFDITPTEGEDRRTFTVNTKDGNVSVLGTRFAVNTYGKETTTVLEEGKVSITSSKSSAVYELSPGELARFKTGDKKITVKKVSTSVYTSWTEDILTFDNTPMNEVAQRIEDTFGVEVVLDQSIKDEALSGSIKSTNLEVLQEALEEILKTNIKERDNHLFIGIKK